MNFDNFESFKKHLEVFSKIDTPEKLANCENQYKHYVLRLEDQKYFEPETTRESDDIIKQYNNGIRTIFHVNDIKENEFYFLIQPSFQPESLLILTKLSGNYLLTHKELESSYWAKVYTNKPLITNITTSTNNLPRATGDKVFELLSQTAESARHPQSPGFILDGIKYYLTRRQNGVMETCTKHSPDETSLTGKIITLLSLLADYTKFRRTKDLETITKQLDNLKE